MNRRDTPALFTPAFFLITAIFFLVMTTQTIFLVLPVLVDDLGGGALQIGLAMGAAPIGSVASRLFWGRWLDRGGRKKVLIFSTILNTAAILAFLTVKTAGPWLVFLRLLQGIALGGNITAVWTITADISPPARLAQSLGIFGTAGMVALAVGPAAGEAMMNAFSPLRFGFQGVFSLAALLSLLALALSVLLKESRPVVECGPVFPSQRDLMRGGVAAVLLVTIFFSISRASFVSFFAEYSRLRGIGSIGVFSAVYSGTTIFFRFTAGHLPDRLGRVRVLGPALIIFGIGIALIAFSDTWPIFVLSAFFCGLGHCFLYPVLNALVIERVHSCSRGTATGIFINAFDIGIGAGSLLWGAGAQVWGDLPQVESYRMIYLLAGAFALLGLPFARRRSANHGRPAAVNIPPGSEIPSVR
jgi:MFS family permease